MKTILAAFAFLAAGVAAGYFMRGNPVDGGASAKDPGPVKEDVRRMSDGAADKNVKVLRERVRDLERRLREADERAQPSRETDRLAVAADTNRPMGFRERMEQMKRDNPQEYQQMTNRLAQFRRTQARHAASRMEYLASIDTSGMSASARRTHEELLSAIAEREELEEKMHNPDLTDDERHELFGAMREMSGRMHRLNEMERDNLLVETAKGLGFGASEAKEVSAAIKEVIDATSSMHRMPGFPGRR